MITWQWQLYKVPCSQISQAWIIPNYVLMNLSLHVWARGVHLVWIHALLLVATSAPIIHHASWAQNSCGPSAVIPRDAKWPQTKSTVSMAEYKVLWQPINTTITHWTRPFLKGRKKTMLFQQTQTIQTFYHPICTFPFIVQSLPLKILNKKKGKCSLPFCPSLLIRRLKVDGRIRQRRFELKTEELFWCCFFCPINCAAVANVNCVILSAVDRRQMLICIPVGLALNHLRLRLC